MSFASRLFQQIGNADLSPAWRRYYIERTEFETAHGSADLAEIYRAKAMLAAPREKQWSGLCGEDVCTNAQTELDGPRTLTLQMVQSDDVAPWVELYVDESLVDEGAVAPKRTFTIPPGKHRVEVELANPMTRNRFHRRVRIV